MSLTGSTSSNVLRLHISHKESLQKSTSKAPQRTPQTHLKVMYSMRFAEGIVTKVHLKGTSKDTSIAPQGDVEVCISHKESLQKSTSKAPQRHLQRTSRLCTSMHFTQGICTKVQFNTSKDTSNTAQGYVEVFISLIFTKAHFQGTSKDTSTSPSGYLEMCILHKNLGTCATQRDLTAHLKHTSMLCTKLRFA